VPARDALHYQMIFMDDLAPGGILGSMLDGFDRSQRGLGMPDGSKPPIDAVPNPIGMFSRGSQGTPYDESGDGLRQYFARHMELTLPFYVDPRMTALVTAAAESMPSDSVLRPEDLPATHGFLLIPQGLSEIDLRGQLMIHNAVAWFQRAGGMDLWFLSNKYEERDMVNQRHLRYFGEEKMTALPQFTAAVYTRIEFGEGVPLSLGSTKVLPPEITETMRVITDPKTGAVAQMWGEGYDLNEWIGDSMEISPNGVVAWIMAMWRLMQQTIIDVRSEPVDRGLRKQVRKRRMKHEDVTVIALRKRKHADGETGTEIEWSHRWLVRGHWRKQWVGPRDGEVGVDRYQTPVWIHPHVKGPDDAPFLVRDHVYSLER
jgi:hypothetical protein